MMGTMRDMTSDGEKLRELIETSALLRGDLCRIRLERWVKWLAIEDVWSSHRIWDWVLDAAISVGSADYANVQLIHPRLGGLELMAHRGFQQPFVEFFRYVSDTRSACGTALKRGRPIIVEDVANSRVFSQTSQLEVVLDAGVRAVKSLPLVGSHGRMMGMLSVHYRHPYPDRNGEGEYLRVLARAIGKKMEQYACRHRNPDLIVCH
jgi:GAF domain-containing protein